MTIHTWNVFEVLTVMPDDDNGEGTVARDELPYRLAEIEKDGWEIFTVINKAREYGTYSGYPCQGDMYEILARKVHNAI